MGRREHPRWRDLDDGPERDRFLYELGPRQGRGPQRKGPSGRRADCEMMGAKAPPVPTPESVEPSVEYDDVDEASLESMPASDSPARGVVRIGEPRRPCDPVPR